MKTYKYYLNPLFSLLGISLSSISFKNIIYYKKINIENRVIYRFYFYSQIKIRILLIIKHIKKIQKFYLNELTFKVHPFWLFSNTFNALLAILEYYLQERAHYYISCNIP